MVFTICGFQFCLYWSTGPFRPSLHFLTLYSRQRSERLQQFLNFVSRGIEIVWIAFVFQMTRFAQWVSILAHPFVMIAVMVGTAALRSGKAGEATTAMRLV